MASLDSCTKNTIKHYQKLAISMINKDICTKHAMMREPMKTKSKFWDKTVTSVPMIPGVRKLAIG